MNIPAKRYGIVAGNGILPLTLAKRLKENATPPFIVSIAGEAHSDLSQYSGTALPLEKIAYSLPVLKQHGATHVVFAGGVKQRPKPLALRVPLSLWPEVPGAVYALT
ncbi:MAG: DUF1009 domain-containing protein, partial [Notoacmeibacter sp.]